MAASCPKVMLLLLILWGVWEGTGEAAPPQKTETQSQLVELSIDPLRNKLTVFINGVPYKTYPIALGKPETPSPVGDLVVINKYKNWGSGFGTRWIGLNVPWGTYGIHGTNRPHSIGQDASHGCFRMLNRHVEELYELVDVGTKVTVLGHPLGEPYQDPRRIAQGDSGAEVQLIQNRLRAAGYYKGRTNGKFDGATDAAVKAFERANWLPIDGVVGTAEYIAMGLLE